MVLIGAGEVLVLRIFTQTARAASIIAWVAVVAVEVAKAWRKVGVMLVMGMMGVIG